MTFKQSVIWNKVTDVLPENDKNYLVWDGHHMVVGRAEIYSKERRMEYAALSIDELFAKCDQRLKDHWINCKGEFHGDIGDQLPFDNPKIYWSELPLAPGEQNPPQPNPLESMVGRDVYLKKDDQIVGLHAVGDLDPIDGTFYQLEIWGNEYDDEHNMLGRGSFRVFSELETAAKEMELDGWVRFEGPKKKES